MNVRKKSKLAEMYAGAHHPINECSPELEFMRAVCSNNIAAAMSYFHERKLFGRERCAVDTPFGRYEGLEGVRCFATEWLTVFHAESASLTPVVQTCANGRVVCEMVVDFVVDEAIEQVPMFVVADLRTQRTIDEIRMYCHHTYVPNLQAYRKPIFQSAHLEMGDPGLLTGAVREYYEALHHMPKADVGRILGCMQPNCKFGGYEPPERTACFAEFDQDEMLLHAYTEMSQYIPSGIGMRYETIIDDGRTCVLEWVHIVTRKGQEKYGRVALSGIAAYERGDDGLLCAIRICDYAGYERTIEWDKLDITEEEAKKRNVVESFPIGVGQRC